MSSFSEFYTRVTRFWSIFTSWKKEWMVNIIRQWWLMGVGANYAGLILHTKNSTHDAISRLQKSTRIWKLFCWSTIHPQWLFSFHSNFIRIETFSIWIDPFQIWGSYKFNHWSSIECILLATHLSSPLCGNMEFKGILTLSLFQMEMELYLERKRIQSA